MLGRDDTNVLPGSLGGVPQSGAAAARRSSTARPGPRRPRHAHARRQRRRLRGGARHVRPRQLQHARVRAQRAAIIDATKPRLEEVYRAIAAKAPHARILVLGYPQLFPADAGTAGLPGARSFRGEQDMLRRLGVRLNGDDRDGGRDGRPPASHQFVPVAGRFAGHEVCGSKGAWMNGDRHQLDRVRARSRARSTRSSGPARRVRGGRQRRPPALTGYQRSSSSRAWASMSATIAAAGRTASSRPIDCPA